jgi:hypothetical protein
MQPVTIIGLSREVWRWGSVKVPQRVIYEVPVINRVRETGLPSLGHGWPFILTQHCREVAKGTRASWILRFLSRE